jgi:hypothetical protein
MDAELNECHATVVELLISLFDWSDGNGEASGSAGFGR